MQADLFDVPPAPAWGSPVELERRRRIRVSVWAYAYELLDVSLVSDAEFDREAQAVDVNVSTGHPQLDAFFREHFADYTGQWVHKHPEKHKLAMLAKRYILNKSQKGP